MELMRVTAFSFRPAERYGGYAGEGRLKVRKSYDIFCFLCHEGPNQIA